MKDLNYWKENATEDYMTTPISVLRYITELEKIKEAKQLTLQGVSNSYAIVRWYDNGREDVVCIDKEIALDYVQKYNKLAGKEECYLDKDVWLPLKEA